MPETPATVFVVNADPAARTYLASVIRQVGLRAETFNSRDACRARTRNSGAGCMLVDLANTDIDHPINPDRSGWDLAELPVIVIAANANVQTVVRAMKAGASDFLAMPLDERALIDAVRNAIDRSTASLSHSAEVLSLRDRVSSLSQREREVMTLVVAGRLNKQVGGALGISEITVKAHRGRMMRKMKADSVAGLVMMAMQLQGSSPQLR